jgi:CheY-like chemotaxis protein
MSTVLTTGELDGGFWKTSLPPGVQIEALEERSLFSADIGMQAMTPIDHSPPQVYEMPLAVAAASTSQVGAAPAHVAVSRVQLTESDDQTILTAVYLGSRPLQTLAHNGVSGISARGTEALRKHGQEAFAGRPPSAEELRKRVSAHRHVLLIEDDPTSRAALATILTRRGFRVTIASNMKEGMLHLTDKPDNVIVDLMLPDGPGEEVVQEIRESQLQTNVTVMTGVSDPARLARLNALHPESILNKPVDVAALLRAISKTN